MKIYKIFACYPAVTAAIALEVLVGCAVPPKEPASRLVTHSERCKPASEVEIAALFDRWNQSLQTGDPSKVVANYAERSILLPTVSNKPRLTPAEKEDYFRHFLEKRPSGKIDLRQIEIGCNMAVDSGLYTFTFAKTGEVVNGRYSFTYRWDGSKWLIISHHSSAMPETK
ncbi:MAG: SgcJ/EcaC family oxidoreductase [Chlamydiota bacterium]